MKLVQWEDILPASASVTFSSLCIPDVERDALNRDIAEVRLPGGLTIDVEWSEGDRKYAVVLYREEYEAPVARRSCENVGEVVEAVKDLVERALKDETVSPSQDARG